MSRPEASAPPGGESGLIVVVPAVQESCGRLRFELDPWAALGVGAHITLLTPFRAPDLIGDDVLRRITRVVTGFAPFSFRLTEVGWFGDDVLWLGPEPAAPFEALTAALVAEFPDLLPYGGVFDEVITHLTVGAYAPIERLRAAAEQIAPLLPISGQVDHVVLLGRTGTDPFTELHRFALGGPS